MDKKILILANNDIGLYRFRKELIQTLSEMGYVVHISLPDGPFVEKLVEMGCIFVNTPMERRSINIVKETRLFFKYRKIIKRIMPNYVITYTIKPNILGGLSARLARLSYAINITGLGSVFQRKGLSADLFKFLYRAACKKAKVVFFENFENRNFFIKNNIVKQSVVCNLNGAGVNLDEYKLTEYPNNETIEFLFIGRVMKEKGMDELLYSVEKLIKDKKRFHLNVVGPMEEEYEHRFNNPIFKNYVTFHGFIHNVKPFIASADCLLLPSYHEGMANTLLEAGAMGRPLITSNIPGCREAVLDGKSGYLVEAKNGDDLYRNMNNFMALSIEQRQIMGIKSHNNISKNFNRNTIIERTIKKLDFNKI